MVKIEPCLGSVVVTTELSPLFQFQKQSVNSGLFSLKKKKVSISGLFYNGINNIFSDLSSASVN